MVIRSLSEFLDLVSQIRDKCGVQQSTCQLWFRGQASSSWSLTPSLLREPKLAGLEYELTRDFKLRAQAHLGAVPQNSLEWLFLMQHFGLPTRLLDWTENPQVALFFAVESDSTHDATVWTLHPWSLNVISLKFKSVPLASDSKLIGYVLPEDGSRDNVESVLPCAVRPAMSNPRLIAQSGVFTIHGKEPAGIEKMTKFVRKGTHSRVLVLDRMSVPREKKSAILRELYDVNVSRETLFPGLEGLARALIYKYSVSYLEPEDLSQPYAIAGRSWRIRIEEDGNVVIG